MQFCMSIASEGAQRVLEVCLLVGTLTGCLMGPLGPQRGCCGNLVFLLLFWCALKYC